MISPFRRRRIAAVTKLCYSTIIGTSLTRMISLLFCAWLALPAAVSFSRAIFMIFMRFSIYVSRHFQDEHSGLLLLKLRYRSTHLLAAFSRCRVIFVSRILSPFDDGVINFAD